MDNARKTEHVSRELLNPLRYGLNSGDLELMETQGWIYIDKAHLIRQQETSGGRRMFGIYWEWCSRRNAHIAEMDNSKTKTRCVKRLDDKKRPL